MMTERQAALFEEINTHLVGIFKCRADMIDEHMMFVKVVIDAIESKAIPPLPIEVANKVKFANASQAMRDHVLGLVRCFVELNTGKDPEKEEVTK